MNNKDVSEVKSMENDVLSEVKAKGSKCTRSKFVVLSVFLVVFAAAFIGACSDLEYESTQVFTSPSGNKEVTVKCDYVSSPYVFYDGEMIFQTDKPGFAETVAWDVEWISEDEIRLYVASPQKEKYSNDNYYIKLDH